MVYALHKLVLMIFKFCKLPKKQVMLDKLEIHVCRLLHSMVFQEKYSITLKRHTLLSGRIYQVYTRYIPGIYYAYTCDCLVAHRHLEASDRDSRPSDLLDFGHREAVVIEYNYDTINIYLSYQMVYQINLESIFLLYP